MEIELNVITYNIFALPGIAGAAVGNFDMSYRVAMLSDQIKTGQIGKDNLTFDILLIEELWSITQHNTIRRNLPPNYHMTEFDQLNIGCWSMRDCSGLAIVSKYPLHNIKFEGFSNKGFLETWAAKGFGQVTIQPVAEISVTAFVAHTVAVWPGAKYISTRRQQCSQMMKSVERSDTDLVIVGGDFNAEPWESAIKVLKQHQMKNSKEDVLDETEWENPRYATYGNAKNPYSGDKKPQFLDYVFHRSNSQIGISSKAIDFQVPTVGLSDHSPIWTKIQVVKYSIRYP